MSKYEKPIPGPYVFDHVTLQLYHDWPDGTRTYLPQKLFTLKYYPPKAERPKTDNGRPRVKAPIRGWKAEELRYMEGAK